MVCHGACTCAGAGPGQKPCSAMPPFYGIWAHHLRCRGCRVAQGWRCNVSVVGPCIGFNRLTSGPWQPQCAGCSTGRAGCLWTEVRIWDIVSRVTQRPAAGRREQCCGQRWLLASLMCLHSSPVLQQGDDSSLAQWSKVPSARTETSTHLQFTNHGYCFDGICQLHSTC